MKHLTLDEKQQIKKKYDEGASLRAIGREMGRPDITIRRILEAMGVDFGPPRTTNRRSSPEKEAEVLALYDGGATWDVIKSAANVTSTTVAKILKRNGRNLERHGSTEGKEEVIKNLYAEGRSARSIARELGLGKTTVVTNIVGNGGEIRVAGCEYPDYFESVDTPEKAYWLGFIAADGCMITTSRHPEGECLKIELAEVDAGHLAKFRETIGATASIIRRPNGKYRKAGLAVGSRRLVEALIAVGITPRKSATVEPWNGPADLMPHYWRGMIDGDGSIARKSENLWTLFFCGSEACVRAFAAWAHGICGTNATPYFKTGCWYVSISGRHQLRKLIGILYENAPVSLDRKQERANAILKA